MMKIHSPWTEGSYKDIKTTSAQKSHFFTRYEKEIVASWQLTLFWSKHFSQNSFPSSFVNSVKNVQGDLGGFAHDNKTEYFLLKINISLAYS